MIKTLWRLCAVTAAAAASLSAAALCAPDASQLQSPEMAGSMMPLDTALYRPVEMPDSLRPVHVVYVARHGARYMTSDRKTRPLVREMESARGRGTVSEEGDSLMRLLVSVEERSAGNWGLLSPTGKSEQVFLGAWLERNWPETVGEGEINAISSYMPRVIQTMDGLTASVAAHSRDDRRLSLTCSSGSRYDPLVVFFVSDSLYAGYLADGGWRAVYDGWVARNVPAGPAERLYRKGESGKSRAELQKMSLAMYDALRSLECSDLGETDTYWFTPEEYRRCWEAFNLDKYLKRTGNPVSLAADRGAAALLSAIAGDLRDAGGSAVSADMYFGHAETLMPLLSLMGLEGCSWWPDGAAPGSGLTPAMADEVAAHWRDYEVVPMGANLVLGLWEGPSGARYVNAILNGRPVAPMGPGTQLTAPLTEVLEYWRQRMR